MPAQSATNKVALVGAFAPPRWSSAAATSTLALSESHSTFFAENKVMLRAEEEVALLRLPSSRIRSRDKRSVGNGRNTHYAHHVAQNRCVVCGQGVRTGNRRARTCGPVCAARFKEQRQAAVAGRTRVRSDGYVEEHTGRAYVLQHRLVMERALGRQLATREHVHHRNGNRGDNRPENLEVIDVADHIRMHPDWPQQRQRRIVRTCEWCGNEYERKASRAGETRFCSASCRSSAVAHARWH
jgi:hypothetical protein